MVSNVTRIRLRGGSGFRQPADGSDLSAFLGGLRRSPRDVAWCRENFDLDGYSSFRAIVEGIHHYDIGHGKNYFFFHDPAGGRWSIVRRRGNLQDSLLPAIRPTHTNKVAQEQPHRAAETSPPGIDTYPCEGPVHLRGGHGNEVVGASALQ